jgi:SAM-dependent methyltransferase
VAESVPFDRAVEYYDRTRALPPAVHAEVVEVLRSELDGRGPCLEIGVGTGRIALSLAGAGIPMVGADLSGPMLHRLVQNAGGAQPFPLLEADATRLPFLDGAVGAALASHVLHLVADWRGAVGELVRVLRPGGVLLVSRGGPPAELDELFQRLRAGMGIPEGRHVVGLDDPMEVDGMLGAGRSLPDVHGERQTSIASLLHLVEENRQSWTWRVPEDVRLSAVAATRTWAANHYGDIDAQRLFPFVVRWRAWEV